MKYSYQIDENNEARVIYGDEPFFKIVGRNGFDNSTSPWTQQDAKNWAEETIQSIKDNGGVYIMNSIPETVAPSIVFTKEDV
jgi:hypothetical protein